MKKYILIYFGFFIAASFFSTCGNNDGQKVTKEETGKTGKVPIDASIFKTDKGWGYSILIDNKLFIRQDIVPAVEGNQGFATKEDATKVAKFVLQKIDNKEKPIVTKEDLKQLGIIQ
jgi:hypothetical protein